MPTITTKLNRDCRDLRKLGLDAAAAVVEERNRRLIEDLIACHADVYLESETKECSRIWRDVFNAVVAARDLSPEGSEDEKELQKIVNTAYDHLYGRGYFRDTYNPYGLFAQLGLSWWQDVIPMLDDRGYLPIDRAKDLEKMVKEAPLCLNSAQRAAREQGDEEPTLESYEKRRQKLLSLLNSSIMFGEPLRMSL